MGQSDSRLIESAHRRVNGISIFMCPLLFSAMRRRSTTIRRVEASVFWPKRVRWRSARWSFNKPTPGTRASTNAARRQRRRPPSTSTSSKVTDPQRSVESRPTWLLQWRKEVLLQVAGTARLEPTKLTVHLIKSRYLMKESSRNDGSWCGITNSVDQG